MSFFNEMSISMNVNDLFPGGVPESFDFSEIWDYSTKKRNIELVCASGFAISAAEVYDDAVGLKIRSQNSNQEFFAEDESLLHYFFKLKKAIFASNLPEYEN